MIAEGRKLFPRLRQYLAFKLDKPFQVLFPNWVEYLKKDLAGVGDVLDLGCGNNSFIRYCDVGHSVGVDIYKPYLAESKKKGYHDNYIKADLKELNSPRQLFDTVMALAVIEHMEKDDALVLIGKMQRWAKKQVIITTPNGFIHHGEIDGNTHQKHISGWTVNELRGLGFKIRGISGWKPLRGVAGEIKIKPAILGELISGITQYVTYYIPELSFVLYATKEVGAKEEYQGRGRTYIGQECEKFERLAVGRYEFSLNFIKDGDICLDAACGSGYGSELLSRKAKEVIGLEIDEHALKFARDHYQKGKIVFHKSDLTQPLDLPDDYFDTIVSIETIEHISNHGAMLGEFRRVLKPGGFLIVSTVEHKIYTEKGEIRNIHHIGELTKKELLGLISRYFKLEELYGQIRYIPLSWNKKLARGLWHIFLEVLSRVDIFGVRYWVVKRFGLDAAVDAVNEGFSTQEETGIEKSDFEDENEYYQLIVIARKQRL